MVLWGNCQLLDTMGLAGVASPLSFRRGSIHQMKILVLAREYIIFEDLIPLTQGINEALSWMQRVKRCLEYAVILADIE